jgi:stage III sporulation protein AA
MTNWDVLRPYLPQAWITALEALPPQEQAGIQELRLRAGEPVILSFASEDRILCGSRSSTLHQPDALVCRPEQLGACFLRFCEESVYAHEQELRQGFIAVRGGIRVGVAGTAVLEGERVRAVRQVTSLCIRLPRRHTDCAASLMPLICSEGSAHSTLLIGEPSSGKTSLLRDIAATLAARRVRVAVVDERGELGGVDGLGGCDVLRGYPKAVGILQAVRCLAPQVVVFDELGDAAEIAAVSACAHAGVATIASLHGRTPIELARKSAVRELIDREVFEQWVFLQGRHVPGRWRECVYPEVTDGEIYWHPADHGGGDRFGVDLFSTATATG